MKFRYDAPRPKFDVVTAIEMGDLDGGYRAIDISSKDGSLYSLTCPLMIGMFLLGIPKYTNGKLTLLPKNKEGQPLKSKVEALDDPRDDTPDLLPPAGTVVDQGSIDTVPGNGAVREIKEWQAIMDHLGALPVKIPRELPVKPIDERAAEVWAIKNRLMSNSRWGTLPTGALDVCSYGKTRSDRHTVKTALLTQSGSRAFDRGLILGGRAGTRPDYP